MKEENQNSELISLLETEMVRDVMQINIPQEEEKMIDANVVYTWYIEAEKAIRVLANILNVPMVQAINQLRYAGHHVLKANTLEAGQQQNLIEAYKHCKRAIFDALDFYVYKLSDDYRVLLPFLDSDNSSKFEGLLKDHIMKINKCRTECDKRIDYYSGVQKTLIEGLHLIEQLNIIQRETGVGELLLKEKRVMQDQITNLKDQLNSYNQSKGSE